SKKLVVREPQAACNQHLAICYESDILKQVSFSQARRSVPSPARDDRRGSLRCRPSLTFTVP
ncbi:MAG TPA: hypothetical protein VF432_14355, partial [Thermoanaerobaculia bacterium]